MEINCITLFLSNLQSNKPSPKSQNVHIFEHTNTEKIEDSYAPFEMLNLKREITLAFTDLKRLQVEDLDYQRLIN